MYPAILMFDGHNKYAYVQLFVEVFPAVEHSVTVGVRTDQLQLRYVSDPTTLSSARREKRPEPQTATPKPGPNASQLFTACWVQETSDVCAPWRPQKILQRSAHSFAGEYNKCFGKIILQRNLRLQALRCVRKAQGRPTSLCAPLHCARAATIFLQTLKKITSPSSLSACSATRALCRW